MEEVQYPSLFALSVFKTGLSRGAAVLLARVWSLASDLLLNLISRTSPHCPMTSGGAFFRQPAGDLSADKAGGSGFLSLTLGLAGLGGQASLKRPIVRRLSCGWSAPTPPDNPAERVGRGQIRPYCKPASGRAMDLLA